MLKILAVVVAVLVVAIAIVLVLAISKPDIFRVERSVVINAPPDKIFPLIADFHQWGKWSPYETRDPAMKRTYSGTNGGKGSVYAWQGDKNVGTGRMEILDAPAPREGRHQARLLQTLRGAQHGRIHTAATGRWHACHMGDAGSNAIHRQDHARLHEHGSHGWHRFRNRPCQPAQGH